jgi:streptomycin 6-kinase
VPEIADRIRSAAMHWHLTVGENLAGGTCSAVYAATDEFGQDLVLKLPETRAATGDVTGAEAAALAAWASTGAAVALVDATADALLLVRVRPGTLMPWRPEERFDDTVEVAADLLRRLWVVTPGSFPYPTLADVYPNDERVAREDAEFEQRERCEPDRGAPGLVRLRAAAAAAERLISRTQAPTLLHGDFITKNLLSDNTSPTGWVIIDPLPMIGDAAAEVAAFAAYQPAELILPIAEALAARVGVAPGRALGWAAIWTVHQTAQAWRDDQEALERLVESSTFERLLLTD